MPVFQIHHITKYEYDRPVKESINEIKIYPYPCNEQEVLVHEIVITDSPEVNTYYDYWGNKAGVFNNLAAHQSLVIESKLVVRTTASSQLKINFHSGFDQLKTEVNEDIYLVELSTVKQIEHQQAIQDIAAGLLQHPQQTVAAIAEKCCEYIFKNFKYIKGITTIETTVDEILGHRSGVCQDFAHLMLQILRTLRIPCRYVSGYICPNKNGMRGEGATHAWVEVYVPQFGWAGIDPTNNVWVTNQHVKLSVGRDFNDCTPVKGVFTGISKQHLTAFVSIGYEDGTVFEELNDVSTPRTPNEEKALYDTDYGTQGVQQQQ